MERLAVPAKRYNRDISATPTESIKHQSVQQSKLSIHVDSKATENRRKNMHKNGETKYSQKVSTKRYTPMNGAPK